MRLDSEAIAGLRCLEEALDCFRDAGLLQFVTDKEHWDEELLLQFYATLHIRGYNRDPKTWAPGEYYEPLSTLLVNTMNQVVNNIKMPWKASFRSQNPT